MKLRSAALFLALLASADAPSLADSSDTETRLDRGDILVTTHPVAGSSTPEVMVQAVIDAPPAKVWELVSRCGDYKRTMLRVLKAREVSRKGDKVVCEVTINVPWPYDNLTATTEATHTVADGKWSRVWHLVKGDYSVNSGSWTLTQFRGDAARTLAVYRVHAVPNSSVPDKIRKRAQKSALPDMIKHLRKLARS